MNNISEIPRLYTAFAEWGACMVYICLLPLRYPKWKIGIMALVVLLIQIIFLTYTGGLPILLWIPCMGITIGIMFCFIYSTTKSKRKDAAYYTIHAFVLAEFVASLERQFFWYFWENGNLGILSSSLFLLIVYLPCFLIAYLLIKSYLPKEIKMYISKKEILGAFIIGIAVFTISNIGFISSKSIFGGQYPKEIMTVRTLVDMGGYAILFAHFVICCQSRFRKELDSLNNILENQYLQYMQSKESIELINQKYHDMKHQIQALRMETDEVKRTAWLDAMEKDITSYEAQNKTGNPVLDVVLTTKSIQCKKNHINLTCVVDGTLLEAIEARDICSIFGNALDNAIECVTKIAEEEKRLIHVAVSKQQGFVMMRFENYFEGNLSYEEGVPKTTKKNKNFHGYGLKSIQMTAQKYAGRVSIEVKGNWFELDIIIPL